MKPDLKAEARIPVYPVLVGALGNREKFTFTRTISGQPFSKANSRQKTKDGRFIKSKKALAYCKSFLEQIIYKHGMRLWRKFKIVEEAKGGEPPLFELEDKNSPFKGLVVLACHVYYKTRKPDLDVSLVMDMLEKSGVIGNDRQIWEQHLYRYLDPVNPRVEIILEEI